MRSHEHSAEIAQQRRVAALEWEANCERIAWGLGTAPRRDGRPLVDLLDAIHRARELLKRLETLTKDNAFGDGDGARPNSAAGDQVQEQSADTR